MTKPILLSTPHMGDRELEFVKEAFDTNWIAPVGPHIDAFEQEFCECIGGTVAEDLFARGLCLPSGSNLTNEDLERVIKAISAVYYSDRITQTPVFIT